MDLRLVGGVGFVAGVGQGEVDEEFVLVGVDEVGRRLVKGKSLGLGVVVAGVVEEWPGRDEVSGFF